ncbi:MAG: N-acetyl-gamma-glutamyl-phosphate reductase [Paracoccaceae bacterium]
MTKIYKIAILGASGYTGAELVRLIAGHDAMEISALTADRKAGQAMGQVFAHLRHLELPLLTRIEDVDFSAIDLAFCALPHAMTQEIVTDLPENLKIVDISADFRLADTEMYEHWYGHAHYAPELQKTAVYGLTEFYRAKIKTARLVAGTGCNAATGQYALIPLLAAGVISYDDIIIDMFCGVSGAGRSAKEAMLHAEVSEGAHPYGLPVHRHTAEFDQEFSKAAGRKVKVSFTPHLMPANRGILATMHVRGQADTIHATLKKTYENEPFITVLPLGEAPATRHVRGSNFCHIGVVSDRLDGHVRVFSVLDNLVKGSSGQALQNANLMLGLPETMGLMQAPLFP